MESEPQVVRDLDDLDKLLRDVLEGSPFTVGHFLVNDDNYKEFAAYFWDKAAHKPFSDEMLVGFNYWWEDAPVRRYQGAGNLVMAAVCLREEG